MHPALKALVAVGLLSFAGWGLFVVLTKHMEQAVFQAYVDKVVLHRLFDLRSIADAQNQRMASGGVYWRQDVDSLGTLAVPDEKPLRGPAVSPEGLAAMVYRAIRFADETTPDPRRYAVLCRPTNLKTHAFM